MQNAKDSFYEVLRGRLAALNPERTVDVRGVSRPGLLVDENEFGAASALADCFHMRWMDVVVDTQGAMPLAAMTCEIGYATAGTAMNSGMDRGRALAAMDGELQAAVRQCPQSVVKSDYSALADGATATVMSTRVWWSDLSFGPVKVERDRLTRVAQVTVMAFQEAGEL